MPSYTFYNKKTEEEKNEIMMISEMEQYLLDNPDWDTRPSAPGLVDPYSVGRVKVPNEFNNLLKKIKKGNSKGWKKGRNQSTIETGNITEI